MPRHTLQLARCVRLLAESSSLIPTLNLQGDVSDKETEHEDTQAYLLSLHFYVGDCHSRLREAVPRAGGALRPRDRQCKPALLAGGPNRADGYRQDGGCESGHGRAGDPFAQRRAKHVSESGGTKSRRHHG